MRADFDVLWRSEANGSLEHFSLTTQGGSRLLEGVVVLEIDGMPAHVRYQVEVDGGWSTKTVVAAVNCGQTERRIVIQVESDRWAVDGLAREDLTGCVDVDLGWTPATNILPMRRREAPIGRTIETDAAWVRLPELTVTRALQTYERLSETEWVYRSESYEAHIVTSPEGLLLDYDAGLWIAQGPPWHPTDGLDGEA